MVSNLEVGFRRSQGSRDDDWAITFTGNFYEAEISANGEPYTVGWKFNYQNQTFKVGDFPNVKTPQSKAYDAFYVTFEETSSGSHLTRMFLMRGLYWDFEGDLVEFWTVSDYVGNERQDFSASISIKSELCLCFFEK